LKQVDVDRLERDAELIGDGADLAAVGRKREIVQFHGNHSLRGAGEARPPLVLRTPKNALARPICEGIMAT
jgi:hypothetical protein